MSRPVCGICMMLIDDDGCGCQKVTYPRWSKEKEMFASWEYPQKTYADGIEECAQRAEAYAYMSPNFTALAEELRAILRKAQEK